MRLFLVLGLMWSALTTGTEVVGAVQEEFETEFHKAMHRHVMTSEHMLDALKEETGHIFYVDNSGLKAKLTSETLNVIVWWNAIPETVFNHAGYLLRQLRFDNFGGEKGCKYYFHIVNTSNPNEEGSDAVYQVYARDLKAVLYTLPATPQAHLDLIEAWANTKFITYSAFKGVPVGDVSSD